ncbi:MAG: cytidylate kinase [Candidatus Eisenbacteria bacterium RBG_16_71_46]|nr:MAG: cytidylate kinase [Candidatus Eisenbacteria bacterium RBG_16_71_46]OGF22287.1 MAG: cytidylate kinase [Candidatus Eisenbacteria bacterium RBG_19FT_COMBO_70_11]
MSFVVTIDGPSAAGKSTTARAAAARLGFLYVDTGALYRALALKVMDTGVSPDDPAAVERCIAETRLDLSGSPEHAHVWLDGTDVSEAIRTPAVSEMASRLAAQGGVRRGLVEIQRALRERGPLVGEGRDLGTVVFPDAEVKIYLDADLDTRAHRRYRELQQRGIPMPLDEVRGELERRDGRDRERADSPLRPPEDARIVDTTGMDIVAQVEAVLAVVRANPACPPDALRRAGGPRAGPGPGTKG